MKNSARKKKKRTREPQLDNTDAIASLKKARSIYKDLIKTYPKHPRRDEALYFLAATSIDLSKVKESMSYFKRLSERHPNSKYVDEALIELGDYYFDSNKFGKAESYYNKVIKKNARSLSAYARYKKAWCAYNQERKKEALKLLKWVIAKEDASRNADLRVRREAIRDIALPFVDLKKLDESIAYYKKLGEPYERSGLGNMASFYLERGDYKRARVLWEELLKLDPNNKKNPQYDISIIESYKMQERGDLAVKRLFRRLPNYLKNSNWYEINSSDPATIRDARTRFEETARKYAFHYHNRAQKTKSSANYETAKQLYRKYLEYFSNTPDAPKIRFYMAEILYKQNDFVSAATEYYKVYKNPQAGNLRLSSIRFALNSLDRQLAIDRKKQGLAAISTKNAKKLKANTSMELIPYSKVESIFLKIGREYLKKFSNTKDAPDILFTLAYLQYDHRDFNKAYTSFWIFMKRYPKHAARYDTANLILDILNRQKNYAKLVAACKKFLRMDGLKKKKFRATVGDILRKAELKRIEIVEKKGKYKRAALAYMEYTKAYGAQDVALFEKALYNAGVNFTKAKMHLKAVEAQEKFLRRFKKSPLIENMLLQVAKTYEKLANPSKAALHFDEFSRKYPKNAQARDALRLAGIYYWGSGKVQKAEATMGRYLKTYPQPAQRQIVEADLEDLYWSEGETGKLIRLLLQKRARKGVSFARYLALSVEIAELQSRTSSAKANRTLAEALRVAQKHNKTIRKSAEGKEAIAKVYFWEIQSRDKKFYNIALRLPEKVLERNLKAKIALLNELESGYARITSFGSGDWAIASTYKTAMAYRHMAESVLQAPVPSELSAEQLELYRNELQKSMITPFNEKALSFGVQCLDKSQELNLLNAWTPKCYTLVSELQPKRYPKVRTFYLPALKTALIYPPKTKSGIKLGKAPDYVFPVFSAGMYSSQSLERTLASKSTLGLPKPETDSISDNLDSTPVGMTYRVIADKRKKQVKSDFRSASPRKKRKPSFAYLNLARLIDPKNTIPLIIDAIEREPENVALHNLLGLAYIDQGNYAAAKTTFLSLVARGEKNAAIWNNLGVIANFEGKERVAIAYFQDAILMEKPVESHTNLGFIALKYHNGFEAKKQFKRSIELKSSEPSVRVGYAVARLQNRELDYAKKALPDLTRKYSNDPYAFLSTAYLLIDIARENQLARDLLTSFMESQGADGDPLFRQALTEAKQGAGNTLPTID